MKKLLITSLTLLAFLMPALAQIDHDFNPNDRTPEVRASILKDQVPEAVRIAATTRFDKNNPLTWTKFPYALKEYGWVYDVGSANVKLDRYEVTLKNEKGNDLQAIYSANGDLIESREVSADVPVPAYIMEELSKSKYKDWKIVGNKEIINYYHDHNNSSVEQHLRLTVEKDNVKREISFNFKGNNF
jgi:hypothetical protein